MIHTIPSGSESHFDHNPFLFSSRIAMRVTISLILKIFRQEILSVPKPFNLFICANCVYAVELYCRMKVGITPDFFVRN